MNSNYLDLYDEQSRIIFHSCLFVSIRGLLFWGDAFQDGIHQSMDGVIFRLNINT